MKLLIAPMAAMAETSGPITRARALAKEALRRGHEPAFCAAHDVNFRPVEGVSELYAPVPKLLGLPHWLGPKLFAVAKWTGAARRRKVESFEQVLAMVGGLGERFFAADVAAVREAIRTFRPDVVFAEFRLSAIVAAKLEAVPVVTGYSYPVQPSYGNHPEHAAGVRRFLAARGLPPVVSSLELFDWADKKIIASSYELEPIDGDDVIHVGPFVDFPSDGGDQPRDVVVAYMGSGTVAPRGLRDALVQAFGGGPLSVFLASAELPPAELGSVHVAPRFDFSELIPRAVAYINHGGQNSIMTGLVHGTPQLLCPGTVFERQYNADSVVSLGAGLRLEPEELTAARLRAVVAGFQDDPSASTAAKRAGQRLMALGGVARVVSLLEELVGDDAASGDPR